MLFFFFVYIYETCTHNCITNFTIHGVHNTIKTQYELTDLPVWLPNLNIKFKSTNSFTCTHSFIVYYIIIYTRFCFILLNAFMLNYGKKFRCTDLLSVEVQHTLLYGSV